MVAFDRGRRFGIHRVGGPVWQDGDGRPARSQEWTSGGTRRGPDADGRRDQRHALRFDLPDRVRRRRGLHLVSASATVVSTTITGTAIKLLGQQVLDRTLAASQMDQGALLHAAQWPAAGPDPFLDTDDTSSRQGHSVPGDNGGGMYLYPRTNIVFPGSPNPTQGGGNNGGPGTTIQWPQALKDFMGGRSLKGYLVGVWCYQNLIRYFKIQSDDLSPGYVRHDGRSFSRSTPRLRSKSSAIP